MGQTDENANLHLHAQNNPWDPDVVYNHHHGNNGINADFVSSVSGVADLIVAATSQATFDTQGAITMGTWYTTKPAAWKAAEYKIHKKLRENLVGRL